MHQLAAPGAVRARSSTRDEYARIRELRKTNPVAAHLRERRFELGLTQREVANAAGTSHTAISRLESGSHTPNLATLQRIASVLDEELLVCFQRTIDGEVERDFAAVPRPPVPNIVIVILLLEFLSARAPEQVRSLAPGIGAAVDAVSGTGRGAHAFRRERRPPPRDRDVQGAGRPK